MKFKRYLQSDRWHTSEEIFLVAASELFNECHQVFKKGVSDITPLSIPADKVMTDIEDWESIPVSLSYSEGLLSIEENDDGEGNTMFINKDYPDIIVLFDMYAFQTSSFKILMDYIKLKINDNMDEFEVRNKLIDVWKDITDFDEKAKKEVKKIMSKPL